MKLSLKDLTLSQKELKDITKLLTQKRCISDYEIISKNRLLDALRASENKNKTRTEKIWEGIEIL